MAGEPGGLPLMAHALREVWRRRSGKTLTEAAYDAIGGVRGAVAHTAEDVYGSFTPAEATAARALLLRMVSPGDGTSDTRRPVDRAELAADPATEHVLERLVRARLLTVDGASTHGTAYELAHEALIDGWPRLKSWIDGDRERLRLHRRLTESAQAWDELTRDAGALYRGTRLTAARETFTDLSCLSPLERDFLTASIDAYEHGVRVAARTTRRLRTLTAGLAVLLCLAVVAGLSAWRQSGVNARQRDEAEARRIADVAQELRTTDPRTAMRLSVAAWRLADVPETRAAVRAAGQREEAVFNPPEELMSNAPSWLSGDGRVLTTVSRDRVVQWDVRAEREARTVRVPGLSRGVVTVSRDARWIAYRHERGTAVRNVKEGTTLRLSTGEWADVDGVFSPSGRLFVDKRGALGEDRARIQVWDVRRQKLLFRYERAEDGGHMPVVSPDDRLVAWCIRPKARLEIHDIATGRRVTPNWPRRMGQRLLRRLGRDRLHTRQPGRRRREQGRCPYLGLPCGT